MLEKNAFHSGVKIGRKPGCFGHTKKQQKIIFTLSAHIVPGASSAHHDALGSPCPQSH